VSLDEEWMETVASIVMRGLAKTSPERRPIKKSERRRMDDPSGI